jgi:hypothetical protein
MTNRERMMRNQLGGKIIGERITVRLIVGCMADEVKSTREGIVIGLGTTQLYGSNQWWIVLKVVFDDQPFRNPCNLPYKTEDIILDSCYVQDGKIIKDI